MSQPPAHIQQQPINGYYCDVNTYKQINNLLVVDHHQSKQNAHYLPPAGHMYLPSGAGMQLPPPPQQQVQRVSSQLYQPPDAGQAEEDMYHIQQQQHHPNQHQQSAPFQSNASHQVYCRQHVPYLQQVSSRPSVQLPHPLINHHLQAAATSSTSYHHHQYSQPPDGTMAPTIYHQQNQYSDAMQQHHYELMPSHHQQAYHCHQQQEQRQYQDNFYNQLGGFSGGGGEFVAPLQTSRADGKDGANIGEHDAELHNHHHHQSEPAAVNELYYQNQMDLHPTIKQQQEEQQKLATVVQQQQQQQHANQMSPGALVPAPPPRPSAPLSQQQRPQQRQPPYSLEQFQTNSRSGCRQHPQQQQQTNIMVVSPSQPQSMLRTTKSTDLESANLSDAEQRPRPHNRRSLSTATPAYQPPPQQPPLPYQQQLQDVEPKSSSDSGLSNPRAGDTSSKSHREPKQQQLQEGQREEQQQQQDLLEMGSHGSLSQDWLDTICRHLIEHMGQFGICVIDNFLGSHKGELILKEVQQLYQNGQHCSKGRVVSSKPGDLGTTNAIRNDWVIWIDGCEDGCAEINNLIQTLCSVITNSARLSLYSNNGLDKVVINKRTKAHVSCYPGNGTRYIKHVDNPNGDGRVITSIYYLNKNWFTKCDGGLLRMFPAGMNEVANIEPLFDRALFFWSDRRNPHEVLPSYRDRFAITVWYIGEERPQV